MSKLKQDTLIYLEWEDAHSRSGWHTKDEIQKYWEEERCIVKEIGWIYKETKNSLLLYGRIQEWAEDEPEDIQYGLLQKIPKSWIRKRKVMRV